MCLNVALTPLDLPNIDKAGLEFRDMPASASQDTCSCLKDENGSLEKPRVLVIVRIGLKALSGYAGRQLLLSGTLNPVLKEVDCSLSTLWPCRPDKE